MTTRRSDLEVKFPFMPQKKSSKQQDFADRTNFRLNKNIHEYEILVKVKKGAAKGIDIRVMQVSRCNACKYE